MKKLVILFFSTLITIALALVIPFIILDVKSNIINNDYNYLFEENKIVDVKIEDVPLVKQEISCGYAIIEMLSDYYGDKVSENELYKKNNSNVSTSTTSGFVKEINNTIQSLESKPYIYLKNDELLLTINQSLLNNKPVAVEFAALLDNEWTLHWAIVTGMDQNNIYINNPYGYKEEISYEEFISRTTFNAFANMPLFYYFGFAYGMFSKNTIIVSK